MIPRGRIDISISEISRGISYCLADLLGVATPLDNKNEHQLICLSVRTGFDLLLTALDLPPGSEIIVSSISIPDMFSIIEAHQLVAVPVGVDKQTLNTSEEEIRNVLSTKTKAILITHLFGAVADIEGVIALATEHNLLVIEDGAQAYAGDNYKGHSKSDVIMLSFGMIKTNTAIQGAVIVFNNASLSNRVIQLHSQLPKQATPVYLKKLVKAFFIRLMTNRWLYTLFYFLIRIQKKDIDQVLSGFTRGFPGKDILSKIRYGANDPLKRLLACKLDHYNTVKIEKRKLYAINILSNIPRRMTVGFQNLKNSYWVLPVETEQPEALIAYVRKKGFDVTSKASSLINLTYTDKTSPDHLNLEKLVYLPMYPKMSYKKQLELINHLNQFQMQQEQELITSSF